ncbi:5-carboxymethyl-2-hydroxymuconate isomerase [Cohaesibacter sp. ES.047]|uniref:5-carboxymethyl-2-hydroxymuconate Delta-isomerase n=1 Tax=Cohaesibacter sp. ES.047 TaxID=1798205 RepID=UPI000BC07AB0|nr:5-carboxymethyl-2-hydroxymuconate Delta-isomerase [Cohaesibacter sp. ES.047]SNY92765.1 5-carboxymethyl-2-hydroxymuconate isomerase [Cohaesibacter sp. ES.047]
MPHMVINYARSIEADIDLNHLMQKVLETAEKTGLFSPEAIRVRAIPVDYYHALGGGKPFIYLEAKLFSGRTEEQKKMMADMLLDCIAGIVDPSVAISVEPHDMEKATYVKR